ncbi:MAG: 4-hydroxy-3-methylbut-2-enyl diphosphate reductase [Nitrospinae bacterium]|nr:4-hydroxy-3-methylbut-2-enyl diphosphate reductase [Nitrospinota bacterium]
MANIKLASTAGFCWGVKRAIDLTLEASNGKTETVYTFGPLIHNPQIINLLESKNIRVKKDVDDMTGGEIIIRTHGISPKQRSLIKEKGIHITDATCPLVAKVQAMIKKYSHKGYAIVIVGSADHAEVVGLKGFATTPVHIISKAEEVAPLPNYKDVFVCAQTTQNVEGYSTIVKLLGEKYENLVVGDTICDATTDRQGEVIALAREVEAMVVVGGKESANTARLASIAEERGLPTFLIETQDELNLEQLSRFENIGVTAGASTPKWVIDDVVTKLSQLKPLDRPWSFKIRSATGFMVKSELYLSLGAVAMTYANMMVMMMEPSLHLFGIAFCAILSTYLLNQLLRPEEFKRSHIRKYNYLIEHRRTFKTIAISSAVLGAILSFTAKPVIGGIYAILLLFGGTYGVNRPAFEKLFGKFSRLKSIPASKDFFVGLAWGIVTVAIPYIAFGKGAYFILPFAITFMMAYVRAVLLDLQDIYSDRMMGKEVLPILMGEKKSVTTIYGVLITGLVFLTGFLLSGGLLSSVAPYYLGIAYLLGFTFFHQKWGGSSKFNFFLDTHYFVMALSALLIR